MSVPGEEGQTESDMLPPPPPLLTAIVSCANVEISENKKRRVLQCQYWRQPAQSNETGKLREGRQNGKGDLKIHSFVSWKLDMRSKIVFNLNSNR